MQAAALMAIYFVTAVVMQLIGFLISRLVDYEWPTAGLLTFLILFMSAYGFAWPVAVRITEWGIRRLGHEVQTADLRDTSAQPRARQRR
jgi:uncharacterized membrane protein YkvI